MVTTQFLEIAPVISYISVTLSVQPSQRKVKDGEMTALNGVAARSPLLAM